MIFDFSWSKVWELSQRRLGRLRYDFYLLLLASTMGIIGQVLVLKVEMLVLSVFCLFFFLLLTIRRLHDLNFRGWWAFFLPFILALCFFLIVSFIFRPVPIIIEFSIFVGLLIAGASIIILLFFRGTHGVNRFGEDN